MKKPSTTPNSEPADIKRRFEALFDKVNHAGADVKEREVEEVRRMMRDHSELELWRRVPGPGRAAIDFLLQQRMAGAAMSEAWRERADHLRDELGYETAGVAEQMLIQHALLCWLQLGFVQLKYSVVLAERVTPAQGRMWDRRVDAAQRRFTRALCELERFRALSAAARYAKAKADAAADPWAFTGQTGPRAVAG